jgi:hypothetical protein
MLLLLILAACTPNPRDQAELVRAQADAQAIEAEARQAALDAETARSHQAALDRIAEGEAVHRQAAVTQAIALVSFAAAGSLAVIVIGIALAASIFLVGRSTTLAIRGAVDSMTIKPDPETGGYPLLVAPSNVARWHLLNPNNNAVRLLGEGHEADPLMVRTDHHRAITAAVAYQARRAKGTDNAAYIGSIRQPMMEENSDE